MAMITVTDVEINLLVIIVMAPSFRSRALRVRVVKVLIAHLDEANVVVL